MQKNQSGSIFLEALLAVVVFSMIVFSIIPLLSFLLKRTEKSKHEPQAATIMQEGAEAAYNVLISSNNWNEFSVETPYKIAKTASNKWFLLSGTEEDIETRYTRKIFFSFACRDDNQYLIPRSEYSDSTCPGNIDRNSRVINVSVEWQEPEGEHKLETEFLVLNSI